MFSESYDIIFDPDHHHGYVRHTFDNVVDHDDFVLVRAWLSQLSAPVPSCDVEIAVCDSTGNSIASS